MKIANPIYDVVFKYLMMAKTMRPQKSILSLLSRKKKEKNKDNIFKNGEKSVNLQAEKTYKTNITKSV